MHKWSVSAALFKLYFPYRGWEDQYLGTWHINYLGMVLVHLILLGLLVQKYLQLWISGSWWIKQNTGWFFSLVPPNISTNKKTAMQPIMAFLRNRIYRNSSCDWLIGNFLFGTEMRGYQWKKSRCTRAIRHCCICSCFHCNTMCWLYRGKRILWRGMVQQEVYVHILSEFLMYFQLNICNCVKWIWKSVPHSNAASGQGVMIALFMVAVDLYLYLYLLLYLLL